MLRRYVLCIVGLLVLTPACSDDGGGGSGGSGEGGGGDGGSASGGNGSGGSTSTGSGSSDDDYFCAPAGQTCSGVDEYVECVQTKCDANYKECLGDGYKEGSFGGACKDFVECNKGCCDGCECDTDCTQGCQPKLQGDCLTCLTGELAGCVAGCPQPTCQ